MERAKIKLGVYDSGVGGLTVVSHVRRLLPEMDIVYIGDTGRAPYGARPVSEIKDFSSQMCKKLLMFGVADIVSACNSISVHMTDELVSGLGIEKDHWLDMVRATDAYVDEFLNKGDTVLVLATEATINSQSYKQVFGDSYRGLALLLLAQYIEENKNQNEIQNYIKSILKSVSIVPTYIFLGCTHYPLVLHIFKDICNQIGWSDVIFIDPAVYVARILKEKYKTIENKNSELVHGSLTCYYTGNGEVLRYFTKVLDLGSPIKYEKIVL
jgi:glutamate racemase